MKATSKEALIVEIANVISNYHHQQQGKAPGRVDVSVAGNLVVALSSDIFSQSEQKLHETDEGRKMIKSARRELRSLTRESAHAAISRIAGCPVIRSYWDIDIRVGEQLEAYVLSESVDSLFP